MAAAAATNDAPAKQGDSLRDTIDSIIVAFILAFVFRAFVVEAFIIPTGSMAPTLYGMHGQLRCGNCGYPFAYNIRPEVDARTRREYEGVSQNHEVRCPNCGDGNEVNASPANPLPADSGDRILVLKWPYDIGGSLLGPHRWDVSVFKDPKDSRTNFIKRLTGLPNEVLEIIDGDLYAAKSADVPKSVLEKLEPGHRKPLSDADYRELDRRLKLQRKTAVAQSSLWMLHYDHDFPPARRDAFTPGWAAEQADAAAGGWRTDAPRIRFDGRGGAESFIHLTGKPIQDNYGYNSVRPFMGDRALFVGDVRLEFVLQPEAAAGHVLLALTKDGSEFRASIGADGVVDLGVIRPQRADYLEPLARAHAAPFTPHHPVAIAFENVDYRVRLEIDGRVVAETTDAAYAPDLTALRRLQQEKWRGGGAPARVRIGASQWPLELWHVRAMRDVFYRPHAGELDGEGQLAEGGAATFGHPILLRSWEYFMCGDNSPQSADSRMWKLAEVSPFLKARGDQYQVGTVPEDQMIGRAFFVYWPSGKRLVDRGGPPIIPNAGKMRIIR